MLAAGLAAVGCTWAPVPPQPPPPDPACAPYERYGDLSGTSVRIVEASTDPGRPRIGGYAAFARCTGTRIEYHRVPAIADALRAGDPAPDLGYLPDAAALADLVRQTGAVVPVSPPVAANVAEFYPETYRAAGSVDGTLYAAPLDGSVKSLVWFSPRVFAARGYRIPTDWAELLALSERSAATSRRSENATTKPPPTSAVGPASGVRGGSRKANTSPSGEMSVPGGQASA